MFVLTILSPLLDPYFYYTVGESVIAWDKAPSCVVRAKELLLDCTRSYGETEMSINQLSLLAWVTSGTKRVCCVTFMSEERELIFPSRQTRYWLVSIIVSLLCSWAVKLWLLLYPSRAGKVL